MQSYAYGFPRLGPNREYKKTIESFWQNTIDEQALKTGLNQLQGQLNATYAQTVDHFPAGEMSAYDPMLDTALMLGVYQAANLKEYYELCRGAGALELTKWFNTNYHYLVPDLSAWPQRPFTAQTPKLWLDAKAWGQGIPYIIGPLTFLKLSKGMAVEKRLEALEALTPVYAQLIKQWPQVHIDEPALALDLSAQEIIAVKKAYQRLGQESRIYLFSYYADVDFLQELYDLPVAALGLDLVRGRENLAHILKNGFPADKILIAGLVDGRNVWKTPLVRQAEVLGRLKQKAPHIMVSNAAPLFHLPITLKGEALDPRLTACLSFAQEKLVEIRALANSATQPVPAAGGDFSLSWANDLKVRQRLDNLKPQDFKKSEPYANRVEGQNRRLGLPPIPTTTIGSFPQTAEVRRQRLDFRQGKITPAQYEAFINEQIRKAIAWQEELGLDVLVHGEFERTDMVEFFAENLAGMATTAQGWIISYGTRVYRPPIIFGDVSRPKPMTLKEIAYAQSLTKKPVKGMLTGPVTIIAWSFVREDIPLPQVAYQIGLALQDEIRDYEKAGIGIVQVDEPAIREKAPVKQREWPAYFDWAVKAFRLTTNTDPLTQIHTHICYAEFGEILEQIIAMDFDVISIESARSRADILHDFRRVEFTRQVGLGVWDIHSPVVPSAPQMQGLILKALEVFAPSQVWVNPDCGLKTRDWAQTDASLKNLTASARNLRLSLKEGIKQ